MRLVHHRQRQAVINTLRNGNQHHFKTTIDQPGTSNRWKLFWIQHAAQQGVTVSIVRGLGQAAMRVVDRILPGDAVI